MGIIELIFSKTHYLMYKKSKVKKNGKSRNIANSFVEQVFLNTSCSYDYFSLEYGSRNSYSQHNS